jgi:hypothetical protein
LLVFVAPALAAGMSGVHKAQATDFSAAKKKKARKGKAEKVEYMRAVPAK